MCGDSDHVQKDPPLNEDSPVFRPFEIARLGTLLSLLRKTFSNRSGAASTVIDSGDTRRIEKPSFSKVALTRSRTDGSQTYAWMSSDEIVEPEVKRPLDPLRTTCARISSKVRPDDFMLLETL